MKPFSLVHVAVASFALLGAIPQEPTSTTTAEKPMTRFEKISKIFSTKCYQCHGGKRPDDSVTKRARIDLTTYKSIMAGGEDGPIIVAGKPEKSLLLDALKGHNAAQMPPRGKPLSKENIALIEAWIKDGAKEKEPKS